MSIASHPTPRGPVRLRGDYLDSPAAPHVASGTVPDETSRTVLSIAEALERMLAAFAPVGLERVALLEARGRFLAEDLRARWDLPPFDNSAMDGYAVRAAELAGASAETPLTLPVVGESRAGGILPPPLRAGTAMRIFTGAPMPEGADAVVIQEDTMRDGERVQLRAAPEPGAHVRARASDLASGAVMLARGSPIGAGEIALLASQGLSAVTVWRRPVVGLLSTGDELRDVSDPAEPGTVVNSNAYALAALVLDAGAVPRMLPVAPDDVDAIAARLEDASAADVVLSTGGVSVGEYDLVHEALRRIGVEIELWKVRIKPGKPITFGRRGRVPVVGLPGNPVSAVVTFEVFVRPGLRRMLGDPAPHPPTVGVELAAPYRHRPGRVELARASLSRDGERLVARLHRLQGSGSLPSLVGVDALVILPADRERFEPGERLEAIVLRARGRARSPFAGLE